MDYKCEICGESFKSLAGLRGHEQWSHNAMKLRLDGNQISNRLAAVENQCQGLQNSIVALTVAVSETFSDIRKEIQAEAKAGYKRDGDIFQELKAIAGEIATLAPQPIKLELRPKK